jgi:hypothetical protein
MLQVGGIRQYTDDTATQFTHCLVDGRFVTSGDDNLCSLGKEFPGCRQSDAAIATCNDGNFVF